MSQIELADHDLTIGETTTVFVVAWIDDNGGGFGYAYTQTEAKEMTRESLCAPPTAQLYRFMVVMPFGENVRERIADTFYDHVDEQTR